jgi:ATP-dependent RNA helicase DeaD
MQFDQLGLSPGVMQAVTEMGYTELTPIQEQTFSLISQGRDLIALAETGSGKTSACAIPLVEKIDVKNRSVQALILVPTRELALQYVDEIECIGRRAGIEPFAVYGGFSMSIQNTKLDQGVHVLVATPGRLIDHLYNSTLTLENVKTVVLDEADEMLKMDFIGDVNFILSCIMNRHQTLLFSATMPAEVEELANSLLQDPIRVELNGEKASPQSISHRFRFVSHHERLPALKRYVQEEKPGQAIIFCNSKRNGEMLYRSLKGMVDSLDYIHGGLDQDKRTSIFSRFKKGRIKIMVATDVAGRGLDFSRVSHIINYDFPGAPENYVHRTGRTGRLGREGTAISLVTGRDMSAFKRLCREKGIRAAWDGKVPDLKKYRAKKNAGMTRRPPDRKRGRASREKSSSSTA